MMRTGLLLSALLGAVGCVSFKPVGPLAKNFSPPPSSNDPVEAAIKVSPVKDAPSGPMIQPAPPPPAPRTDVTPGEVTDQNTGEIIKRLQAELEADRRAAEAMPRPSEVSVVK